MDTGLEINPELGVPLPIPHRYSYGDLRERVDAACNSAAFLSSQGAEYQEPTDEDKEVASKLATEYVENEGKASNTTTNNHLATLTPEAIIYAKSILDEYGHRVAENAVQIRNLVTTKLIQESENADPRVRLKALELLGKISDVGLFSEKTEVTITHQTNDEIKSKLRAKLEKLVNPPSAKRITAKHIEEDEDLLALQDIEVAEYEEVKESNE